ncbi:hypothetical protein [Pantoea sp. At-9b]|uniref:hypothetical protein n=1 Tax=Pantoea sp. (strain At-9b) TaxID=592316 RepID=UPI0001B3F502|nr:hypothetical protein [Pantoea sp. At-9b]ADU69470.1 hypothetical protein Pat9b_2158 [Pantoea sp. At-9b]
MDVIVSYDKEREISFAGKLNITSVVNDNVTMLISLFEITIPTSPGLIVLFNEVESGDKVNLSLADNPYEEFILIAENDIAFIFQRRVISKL